MASTPNSRWIQVETNDGSFDAYLSLPPAGKQANGPGIVLIQEIFGVNEHIRSVADQYAADGYVVLAPDIFWRNAPRVELGYAGADMEQALSLRKATDVEAAISDIAATVKVLRAETNGGKVAAVVSARSTLTVAVPYYGGGIHANLQEAPALSVPAQFHFGALDAHITLDHVAQIRAAVAGKPNTEVFVYEKADHGFNCWARASYHQPSAALAHGRALTFLSQHLS